MKLLITIPLIIYTFLLSAQGKIQNYFQQKVEYKISVQFIEKDYSLRAFEKLEYTNNSSKKMDTLYFHIWPNAYKNLDTEFGKEKIETKDIEYVLHQEYYRGYIDSLNFKVNNKEIQFYLQPNNQDIAVLILNQSLLPKQTISISTPFHIKIPISYSRLGYTKESIQITQWYPKPAVYDLTGWHYFPYRDMGEFYSEYGKFEVDITIPNNYTLAATGNLDQTIIKNEETTYTYSEDSIHDFAWFADTNFITQIDSVQLPNSQRWVKTICYYKANSQLWQQANKYLQDAIYYYSLWLGDYPYKTCKAVQASLGAGGGMEYPTITVVAEGNTPLELEDIIIHEVGHNWFYGILGNNEREFPWMDEGLNSAYENRYLETKYPNAIYKPLPIKRSFIKYNQLDYYSYMFSASRNSDQICNLGSEQYNKFNYGTIVYKKSAAIINYLRYYLGDEEFDRIMKIYFKTWKFKHPQPSDLEYIFTKNSTKDLSWFFNDLLNSRKKSDYKIKSITQKENTYYLKIRNTKKIKSPLFIQVYKENNIVKEIITKGFSKDSTFIIKEDFDKIFLDKDYRSIDYNRNNNYIKPKGWLKKYDNLKLEFIGGIDKENTAQIFYSPVIGYNTTNKFMLGTALMSNLIFPSQLEYLIMPMFSFGNHQISGETQFSFRFDSKNIYINEYIPYINSKSYGLSTSQNYFQVRTGLKINFTNFLVSNPTIQQLDFYYSIASDYSNYKAYNQFINIEYSARNNRWVNPFNFDARLINHKDFALLSAKFKQELSYSKPQTGLKIRLFTGLFLFNNSNNGQFNLSLSGTSGGKDYLYENTFIGRNDTQEQFWSHQFIANEGGFSYFAPFSSNKWMSSMTISSTLPFKTPLEFYFSIAAFEESNKFFNKGLAWETGISLHIIKDVVVIYIPITADKQIIETNNLYTNKFIERVRFSLLLNKANIINLSKNINQLF